MGESISIDDALKLAQAHYAAGRLQESHDLYARILSVAPATLEAHVGLGNVLLTANRADLAEASYRRALAIQPNHAEGLANLGIVLAGRGDLQSAIEVMERSLAAAPGRAEVQNNLANALVSVGRVEDAIARYRVALAQRPNYAEALDNLAKLLMRVGRWEEAGEMLTRLVALEPRNAAHRANLGVALAGAGRRAEAVEQLRASLALEPDDPDVLFNLANCLLGEGKSGDAIEAYQRAVELAPNHVMAHVNLGNALRDQGRLDDALASFRRAVELAPGESKVHSMVLYALWFHPAYALDKILAEHGRWNERHVRPLMATAVPHVRERGERRLRIGYLSPDFREHVVGMFIEPLIARHDRTRYAVTCYSDATREDAVTRRIRGSVEHWRNSARLSDEQLAQQIRDDDIDVLVDLTLHMAGNRMMMFARKSAPVQVTYLGYAATTGSEAIDYRLTDEHLDPPGMVAGPEALWRLPSYWCYVPPEGCAEPGESPARHNGYVTFSCLNNLAKVNRQTIFLWGKIFAAVPDARLMIYGLGGREQNQYVLRALAQAGISEDRVEVVGVMPRREFVGRYSAADIALDTIPCAGGVTTMDALWMGVPVVTRPGETSVSRAGACILSHIQMPDLIAESQERYVEIAIALAQDLDRLTRLRAELRDRLQASKLMNPDLLVRSIEDAFQAMYQRWEARA